jgi:hypothetical protein
MFYYIDLESFGQVQRHILQPLADGAVKSFPLTDDNPNKAAYDAWVAEGNTAEEWAPEENGDI